MLKDVPVFGGVNTRDPGEVAAVARDVYLALFPREDGGFVDEAFRWAVGCFEGQFAGYQPIDVAYHDLEHTLQGTLCLVRLLERRQRLARPSGLTPRLFRLGLIGILFHDSGYLKAADDRAGSGAKYTLVHVERSVGFVAKVMSAKGFGSSDIAAAGHMIRCTGVQVDLAAIPFHGESEREVGCALGTADLLGQMAAVDYVEKLPTLYAEFEEAARFQGGWPSFVGPVKDADDLIRRTPDFYAGYVRKKLRTDFGGIYRFLNRPFPDGPNEYLERIEVNMRRIGGRLC